jgi:hypothetical protein
MLLDGKVSVSTGVLRTNNRTAALRVVMSDRLSATVDQRFGASFLTGGGVPDREAVRPRHTPVRQEPESARNTINLSRNGKLFVALAQ